MSNLTHWISPFENIYSEIEIARTLNFITDERSSELYIEIDEIIYELAVFFNHHKSTSISMKCLKRIILTIDYVFKHGFDYLPNRFAKLNEFGVKHFYDIGMSIIENDIYDIKKLYSGIGEKQLPFYNDRYMSIINEQIPNYLNRINSYNSIFYYCYTDEDLDYPLIDGLALNHDMYNLKGSDLVLEYLKRFNIENSFCFLFADKIHELISHYEIQRGISIEYIGLNLFETLLNQILVNYMLHRKIDIILCAEDVILLKQQSNEISIKSFVEQLALVFKTHLDDETYEYIIKHNNTIIRNIDNCINQNVEVLTYHQEFSGKQKIKLTEAVSSYTFQKMLYDLQQMNTIEEKFSYYKSHCTSVYDLIDLLESDILYDDEYLEFYSRLSPEEISIILLTMNSEITAFNQEVHFDDSLYEYFDLSVIWVNQLINYILKCSSIDLIRDIKSNLESIKISD